LLAPTLLERKGRKIVEVHHLITLDFTITVSSLARIVARFQIVYLILIRYNGQHGRSEKEIIGRSMAHLPASRQTNPLDRRRKFAMG
jgi:hypothetical protein